jgi:hypothetical protein
MENLFEEIALSCKHKQVQSIGKKLAKKLSFKSGNDVENLCHLTYWLYILGEKDFAKKCIALTHNLPFDSNHNVWTFIHTMWGLEIRILQEEGRNNETVEIAHTIDQHYLTPSKQFSETLEQMQADEKERRNRFGLGIEFENEISNQVAIEDCLNDNDVKSANEWRFIALLGLIGDTATGLYPNLNKDVDKIEEVIKKYVEEILKKTTACT